MTREELVIVQETLKHLDDVVNFSGDALNGVHVLLDFGYDSHILLGPDDDGQLAFLGYATLDKNAL